jgi:hypothetical protein
MPSPEAMRAAPCRTPPSIHSRSYGYGKRAAIAHTRRPICHTPGADKSAQNVARIHAGIVIAPPGWSRP